MEKTNVTTFPKEKVAKGNSTIENSLSPREIVSELDRFVVGQNKAKRAVAIALRNRWSCLLYTSPSPRDKRQSRMPSSA